MWQLVRSLRDTGVTIILTTHYIDEAEEMADRIGVINKGEIILVEDKAELMRKLGKKQLTLQLQPPLAAVPPALSGYRWNCRRRQRADLHLRRAARAIPASRAAAGAGRRGHRLQGPAHGPELAGGYLRQPGEGQGDA
jgi:ABC-type multidrug transport system ATPase subunit